MQLTQKSIEQAAQVSGISVEDVAAFFAQGAEHTYAANEWLFQESAPRQWAGILLDGEVEIVRGLHGSSRHLAVMTEGALISEGLLLDDDAHANGAYTRNGAVVWQISRAALMSYRANNPETYCRIVSRVAVNINRRMRRLSAQLHQNQEESGQIGGFRLERDALGTREIANQAYYGVQTLRAMENFSISGACVHNFEHLIEGLAMVKKAAAMANYEQGRLDNAQMWAICDACDELLHGRLHAHFTVDMFQGGAGASTNMNANEVIANRGLELMGHQKGEYAYLHPNDHVNCSQSPTDAHHTAAKLAVLLSSRNLVRAMRELERALARKAEEFCDALEMGSAENQDAATAALGRKFRAHAVMIGSAVRAVERANDELTDVNMGADINSPPGLADLFTKFLIEVSGFELRGAGNPVESSQNAGAFVQTSASLKRAAVQISQICNDLRRLAAIRLPPVQSGSSVVPEAVNQVCYQVMGYDAVVSMAAEAGGPGLCMAEPLIAYDLLHGMMLLKNACVALVSRSIDGLEANRAVG